MKLLDWFSPSSPEPVPATTGPRRSIRSLRGTTSDGIVLTRTPTDLRSLVETALIPLAAQAAEREINLTVHFRPRFPAQVSLDGYKIAWAVAVLVGNSLRFVRHGTRLRPGGNVSVEVFREPEPDEIVVEVKDDGDGIPPEALAKLLSREPEPGRIPSFGLLLVEDIVSGHGGLLEIASSTSAADHGTDVTLRLGLQD